MFNLKSQISFETICPSWNEAGNNFLYKSQLWFEIFFKCQYEVSIFKDDMLNIMVILSWNR